MLQAQATDSVCSWRPDAVFSNAGRRYRAKSYNGAPRPMKMGTTASPWRYEAGARYAIPSATPPPPTILHYALLCSANVLSRPGALLRRPGAALTSVHAPPGALKALNRGPEQYA